MFKRFSTMALVVLLELVFRSMQLQAMYIPDWMEHELYVREGVEQESRVEEQATSCFAMIQDDDCLAQLIVNQLLPEVMDEAGWIKSHRINNDLIDFLKAFNESEAIRLSVQRKVLINLLDICDANFRDLRRDAKDAYLIEELMELLKNNVDYQTHFKRWIINLREKIAVKVQDFAASHSVLVSNGSFVFAGISRGCCDMLALHCGTAVYMLLGVSLKVICDVYLSEMPLNEILDSFKEMSFSEEFTNKIIPGLYTINKVIALLDIGLMSIVFVLRMYIQLGSPAVRCFAFGYLLPVLCLAYLNYLSARSA